MDSNKKIYGVVIGYEYDGYSQVVPYLDYDSAKKAFEAQVELGYVEEIIDLVEVAPGEDMLHAQSLASTIMKRVGKKYERVVVWNDGSK